MKRSIPGLKDSSGAYITPPQEPKTEVTESSVPDPDVCLEDVGKRIIVAIDRATKMLLQAVTSGNIDRETIGALKDCFYVYKDMRRDEQEMLANLSDEQLAMMSSEGLTKQ